MSVTNGDKVSDHRAPPNSPPDPDEGSGKVPAEAANPASDLDGDSNPCDIYLEKLVQFQPSSAGLPAGLTKEPKKDLVDSCVHLFRMVKSENTLMQWTCRDCQLGPSWVIWTCQYCQAHVCRGCKEKRCGETGKEA
ncbi:hypothetical protein F5144DRAFT_574124 [Chaetomium tenue]|uniref:Uncharacterized protein n=1 Tax=Chaetomium tenue TaxID=1854479 RepID=A0ACB7P8Z5_9PEZI|nr:hypothetical protein F5144DRAFT_574124 [Chaetomium globosum]